VRHIVEEIGGGLRDGAMLEGVMIGGPLAGMIPPHLLDTPFGFEELP
jgi:NADH:ubiquinone oxidoreductase subunit F (NADH-binding)